MNDMEQDNQITEQNLQPDLYGDAGKKKRKKPGFAAGVVVGIAAAAVILVGGTFGICKAGNYQMVIGSKGASKVKNTKLLDQDTVDKVDELTNYMDLYYYEDYDVQDVQDGLLEGVVSGLGDKYSAYYTAEEYKEQQLSTSGTYYGIGAALAQDKDTMQVTITKIYEGTPSEEAGLKKDDVIVLKEWNNLEHLNISGNGLTEEIQQYLCDILPCFTIKCNGKLLSNHN